MSWPEPPADWANLRFFNRHWPDIKAKLTAETRLILPPPHQIFAALELCPPDDVRVIVLGQDPYPTPGHAHGLAFSVERSVSPLPRSLGNIFKELDTDIGTRPANGDLRFWARQGVLLLNASLTVPAGEAGGHMKLGWAPLMRDVLERLADRPRALILWGGFAQKTAQSVQMPHHFVVQSAHPSPLSARRGFFGSRPFSRVNDWLKSQGHAPIDWTGHGHHP